MKAIVGVSACLLGEPVRYDGGDKRQPWIEELRAEVELVGICPELELGLGVPRPPIQMVPGGGLQVVGGGRELGPAMAALATRRGEELAARLAGYVWKARSPSCGLSAPVFASSDASAAVLGREPGRFAAALLQRFPDLPVAEEEALATPRGRAAFLARVRAYRPGPLGGRGMDPH